MTVPTYIDHTPPELDRGDSVKPLLFSYGATSAWSTAAVKTKKHNFSSVKNFN